MSTKDAERELEIEGLVDLPALRKLRRSRKGQLTKLEKDLERYRDQSLGELKRPTLESMLTNFDKQHLFYTLIQDRILYLLHDHTTGVITEEEEKEEMERETQHFSALAVRERLLDMMTALDALLKAKHLRKRLEGFQKSDSLADIDMLDKLQKMDSVIDELLESEASLPEREELSKLIQEVQLLYRRQTKEALRSCPDKAPTADSSRSADSGKSKLLYGLPKTDMPVFEGEPKMWRKFWEKFMQRLAMHPDLPASEKIAQLEQAIKPIDGKALISAPKGTETEYKECIKNLRQRYDLPRKIIVCVCMRL